MQELKMPSTPTTKGLFAFIWKYVRPQKWIFFIVLIASLAWSFDSIIWPYILRVVIDILGAHEQSRAQAFEALKWPIVGGLLFWISVEVGFRTQGILLARAMPKLEAEIRMGMFDHIQRHSPKYFNEHFAGGLANKITDMTTQVSQIVSSILTLFIPTFATSILAIAFLGEINPLFIAIITGWIIVHFVICFSFGRLCETSEHDHGLARTLLLGKIVDSFTNNFAVNLYYRFRYEKKYISRYQQVEQEKNYAAKRWVEIMRICLGQLTFWVGCVLINWLMLYLWLHDRLTTGEVAQIFNTTWSIIMMLWFSGTEIPRLLQSIGLAKQALTVMYDPQDLNDKPGAVALNVTKGEIIFDDVTFHYGKKSVFKNKNVHIRGGEKIGLVGYSGAGKSTFSNLVLRLFPVESGRILIDGQNIADVTLESLRRNVALIPQDPMLFHRTIAENIQYGDIDSREKDVQAAAKSAHCAEFIAMRPEGYDTQVGERGTKLSGGEKQRVAIARAIMADAPILILDEATSALDSVTEGYIQETLDALMQGKTTLVIAHRLSTLARMDRILVFDQGKIIEEGSHEQLLALGKHYANMWQLQAGGFLPADIDGDDDDE
jgi:ATP-binding cassette subfamily B protein